ncbi:diaminopimelate epimerase [Clostridium sp. CAG:632]|nr:diaminopimelate epimerase [Clostridium sp.]CCY59117.1 diaminopimelate epimerase [Clostridium sp. CAG:632]
MKFTKMEGLGNDYVYINCFQEKVENPGELAIRYSNRHFGIGSDGVILIKPSEIADFCMDMYNADGSRSEMCGNGIRCVGKYVYDYGLTDKTEISVETLAGIKYLKLILKDGKVDLVTVDMGEPELQADKIPVALRLDEVIDQPIQVGNTVYQMTCVSMGNPHAVVFVDAVDKFPLETVGPLFEHHVMFPNRVNAEFIEVLNRKEVNMRVWERGTGETLACGTGACASTVACILNHKTEDEITLHLLGGDLKVAWDREKNKIYMTGPARVVFDGEIN